MKTEAKTVEQQMNEVRYAIQRIDFYLNELAKIENEAKGHTVAASSATIYLHEVAGALFENALNEDEL